MGNVDVDAEVCDNCVVETEVVGRGFIIVVLLTQPDNIVTITNIDKTKRSFFIFLPF